MISGGIINSDTGSGSICYGIYNSGDGNIKISEGHISGKYGIYNESSGNIEVIGGTIDSTYICIYNSYTGNIIIKGGTIEGNSLTSSCGVYNLSIGNVIIEDGTINIYSREYQAYGIYNFSTGIVEITGGIIISEGGNYSDSYGVYNNSTGNVIIGVKSDNLINVSTPYIYGKNTGMLIGYGIYNPKGILYFYDGQIEGKTRAINGNIKEIEENAELLITKSASEKIQLELKETNAVSVNRNRIQFNTKSNRSL